MQTVGSRNLQQKMATDTQNALNLLLGQMYETSGGPNQATIRQLEAQRLAAQKNYKTNRADAQNLYGVLSQDIQEMGADLQTSYGTAIGESEASAAARQAELSAEQARQQANRQKAAAELGLAPESIQTNYASDEALNTGMGNVAAGATNWENLLRSQKESAMERTNRLVTATGNTKTQTLLGMKAFLDAQQAQINAQIAGERGKTPTQKLTPLGKILSGAMNEQTLKQAQAQFPELFGSQEVKLTKGQQAAQDVMTQLGINSQQYSDLLATGTVLLQEGRAAELTNPQRIVLASLGVPQYMFGD
jgi:sulfite reductase alpha subunit-like flavoprotein